MPTLRCLDRHIGHVIAVEQDPAAGIRRLQTGDDAQHRGLAAAGGTEQHQRFAARDVERSPAPAHGCRRQRSCRKLSMRTATPCPAITLIAPRSLVGEHLHRDQQRNDHDEEDQRVGGGDLQPHRGVAVGKPDRQRLGQRRVQHPGQIELAERERHHHQRCRRECRAAHWARSRRESAARARRRARRRPRPAS